MVLNVSLMKSKVRYASRCILARDGIAAVEMAAIAPVFVLVVLGICDFGLALRCKTQVANAARVGAEYVMVKGYSQAGAQNAAQSATALAVTANVTTFSGCPIDSGFEPTSGAACAKYGSTEAGNYASITTSATYEPAVRLFWTTSQTYSTTVMTRY